MTNELEARFLKSNKVLNMKNRDKTGPMIIKEDHELIFQSLTDPRVISEFIEIVNRSSVDYNKNFILNFKSVTGAYPNVCVPLAGMIWNLTGKGYSFDFYYLSDYLKKVAFQNPFRVKNNTDVLRISSLDKIWRFESADDMYFLVNEFTRELSQVIVCEKGVIEGFEWSINEVLDNVLQHSTKSFGFVMGQVHEKSKHFVFCVYDTGQGIYQSLLNSEHKPRNPVDALKLAVSEGITRDKSIGQGNGLWGLHQIVKENTGQLNIISGSAAYSLINNKVSVFPDRPHLPLDNGCIVDFQLDYSKEISVSKALGGYEPVNLTIESAENEAGDIVVTLRNKESGVGTRTSGEKIRHEMTNLYKQSNKTITLDFAGINIISSSFADELLGKLVIEFGFYGFNNVFKLKNMNADVQSIVQRSVAQRMMESYNGKNTEISKSGKTKASQEK